MKQIGGVSCVSVSVWSCVIIASENMQIYISSAEVTLPKYFQIDYKAKFSGCLSSDVIDADWISLFPRY